MEIDGNRYGSLGGVKYRAPYGAKNGIRDVLDKDPYGLKVLAIINSKVEQAFDCS